VTAPGGAVTNYTYDANGNQTAAGARTYTYDAADRTTTARIGTTTETYTWSGDGLRLSASTGTTAAKTTRYVWDRNFGLAQLAIERNGSDTTLRSYAYALDLLSQTAGTSTFYYHHDGLGSVSDVTAAAGKPLAWYEYQPFGALRRSGADTKAPTNLFRFTGEYLDTFSGLYHLRARQYDPGIGRFLSHDPVAPTLEDPYVASYVYVRNSPENAVDPSGEFPWILAGALVGGALGAISYAVDTRSSGAAWDWGQFAGSTLGGAASGAIATATGGAVLAFGARAAATTAPLWGVRLTQTVITLEGGSLAWAADTSITGVSGLRRSRGQLMGSLLTDLAGPFVGGLRRAVLEGIELLPNTAIRK